MDGKTNFSRRLKQFDGLTWLTLTDLHHWYASFGSEDGSDINSNKMNLAEMDSCLLWMFVHAFLVIGIFLAISFIIL